jgi:hypothetical protein
MTCISLLVCALSLSIIRSTLIYLLSPLMFDIEKFACNILLKPEYSIISDGPGIHAQLGESTAMYMQVQAQDFL